MQDRLTSYLVLSILLEYLVSKKKRIYIILILFICILILLHSPVMVEIVKGFFSTVGQPAEERQQLDKPREIDQNDIETHLYAEAYLQNDYKNALKQKSLGDKYEENCNYVAEFFTKYSLEDKDSTDSDFLYDLEVIARNLAELKMWKDAVIWYYCLFNQKTTGNRRERIINDLQYTSNMWSSSDDFIHDISNQSVKAVVNDTNVNFRHEPVLENNVIRQFKLHEKVHILQRSDFKQSIKGVNAYWYKISSEDGTEGWIFGQFLMFFP